MSDQRSKKETLKTLPEAPRAKVGPRVAVPDVPPLAAPPVARPDAKTLQPPVRDSMDDAATHIFDSGKFRRDVPLEPQDETSETYHRVDPAELVPINTPLPGQPKIQAQSMKDDGTFKREVATPIKAISMKTPNDQQQAPAPDKTPMLARPKLRAMSEVAGVTHKTPVNLGYLAPPRDPREVRARRTRDLVIWACVCVMLACVFALGIWFLAR